MSAELAENVKVLNKVGGNVVNGIGQDVSIFWGIDLSDLTYTAQESSFYSNNHAWIVFDRSQLFGWHSDITAPHWVSVSLPNPKTVLSYEIGSRWDTASTLWEPLGWDLEGSYDGTNWFTADSRTSQTWVHQEIKTFTVTTPNNYDYYRLNITNSGDYVFVSILNLYNSLTQEDVNNIIPLMSDYTVSTSADHISITKKGV